MAAYYNEIEPFTAQWLRNLITANLIAPGEVDDRSIADVSAEDLRGFTQCHFFAGLGGWSYALRLAGWPDDRPVWTGSCPCQPFSAAGKGGGYADERHLWPHWYRLIRERRPSVVFGEQVDAAIRTGWLDDVCLSLEELDYAVGAVSFPACSVGAPHIRQRLYFVADSRHRDRPAWASRGQQQSKPSISAGSTSLGATGELADSANERYRSERDSAAGRRESIGSGDMGDAEQQGSQGLAWHGDDRNEPGRQRENATRSTAEAGAPVNGFWHPSEWLPCRDGKARPTKPGLFPLAHGYPGRVGVLRAAGNSIVAPQAAEFIRAYMSEQP